jgi:hypothetical protein
MLNYTKKPSQIERDSNRNYKTPRITLLGMKADKTKLLERLNPYSMNNAIATNSLLDPSR